MVIEGRKQVTWGGERRTCAAGDALFLPADAVLDVVNDPDPATDIYRALYLQFSRARMIEAARRWPEFASREPGHGVAAVPLDGALSTALTHVAEGLHSCSQRMNAHRLLGVVGHLAERGIVRWHLCEDAAERSVRMRPALLVNDSEAFVACAIAGLGLIQVPRITVADHFACGTLVELLGGLPAVSRRVSILYPSRQHLTAQVRAFIKRSASLIV